MTPKILLTGASGILGRYAVAALAELMPDAEVYSDRFDICDLTAVDAVFHRFGPFDIIFHMAAKVLVTEAEQQPKQAFATNVEGTQNLLRANTRSTRAKFVLASTGHVYPPGPKPKSEQDAADPASVYAKSKYGAEQAVQEQAERGGFAFLIGRIFSIHDPDQPLGYLRANMEQRLRTEDLTQEFEIVGGNSVRDFLPARVAARYLVALGLSQAQGLINIASGMPSTVSEFVSSLTQTPLKARSSGPADCRLADVTRLNQTLAQEKIQRDFLWTPLPQ